MKITAIKCPSCGDVIFSRARHDFRSCSCGNCFVDGGLDYLRCGGNGNIKSVAIEVNATEKELYDDWNYGTNKW